MRKFYSKSEQRRYRQAIRYYMDMGYPYQKAKEYADDHLFIDRKAKSVYQETK